MSMLKMSCLLLLAAAPVCLAQAPVKVEIALREPGALEASYTIPPSCPGLAFSNPAISPDAAQPLRSDWTALDTCTEVDAHGIRPTAATCRVLRVRVPATMRAQDARVYDRIYPWAQPAGNGVYLHTSSYAVTDTCGALDWTFAAPGGTVVVDGVASSERASPAADVDAWYLPAVLIAQPYRKDAPPLLIDDSVKPAMRTFVETTVAQTRNALEAMLPGLPMAGRYMVVGSTSDGSLRSDVANNTTIRLTLPSVLTPENASKARAIIVHETAHLPQRLSDNDAWHEERAAISEGGAEFLRLAILARLQWEAPATLQDQMEAAVNSCLLALDGAAWTAFGQRGRGMTPYHCGLTLHLIGLATAQGGTGFLERLRDYYAAAVAGTTPIDFGRALECGRDAACIPRWLSRVPGTDALADIVLGASRLPHSALGGAPAWGPRLTEVYVSRHLAQLMQADCNGDISIYNDPGAPRIGPVRTCAALREGMVIVGAEGLPLFTDGKALKASLRACRQRGSTVLGLRDGASITVACNDKVSLPSRVFGVDIARVSALTR